MSFDYVHMFDLCVRCKKIATIGQQNYIDPNTIEQATRLAILSLSKKTMCQACRDQVMQEVFRSNPTQGGHC